MATSIDELLDRAITALNEGELGRAHSLAGEVLASDGGNLDATELLATEVAPKGEIRRLTVMFCDLVGSTELSERLEPEAYRTIVARFQRACRAVIQDRYDGFIVSLKGDGILASFGFPVAHENDADRAVRAGLDVLAEVRKVTDDIERASGEKLGVRIAVHKGLVFLDLDERDLYGFAVNVAARLEGLAETNSLLISEEVKRLIGDRFDFRAHEPRTVKGVSAPLTSYTVLGEGVGAGLRASGPIIGRAVELDLLAETWERARDGGRRPGECVTIVGDAGIGKSRLAAAVAEVAEKSGAGVVDLVGSPLETTSGLWPIRQLIASRCGFTRDSSSNDRLSHLRARVAQLGMAAATVPPLATLLGIPPDAGYDEVESDARRLRDEIDDAALAFLRSCFEGESGVLVCEDAHWYDEQTFEFVKRATQQLPPEVLTVVTSREAKFVPSGPLVVAVSLEPLEREDALDLLYALHPADRSNDELIEIVNRGDGIPLFLEELLRTSAPGAVAGSIGIPSSSAVPEVLYEPLIARLNVSQTGTVVASAAAAIGTETDRGMLSVVSEVTASELDEALRVLVDAHIFVLVDDALDHYRFRHELLRQVAYDLQPPTRRRAFHSRIADALVVDADDDDVVDWQRVADHLATAGRVAASADAYERASESARRRGALVEAKLLLSKAIDALADAPEATATRHAGLRLGRAYLALSLEGNHSAEAAADYERCLELLVDQPVGDEMIATLIALWSYYAARAEFDRCDALLDQMQTQRANFPPLVNALIEGAATTVAFYRGDNPRASECMRRQKEFLAEAGAEVDLSQLWFIPLDPLVIAKVSDAWTRIVFGDFAGALTVIEQGRTLCAALPFPRGPFTLASFLGFESWFHFELGDYGKTLEVVDEMAEISERHGFDTWAIIAATQRQVYAGLQLINDGGTDAVTDERRAAFSALASTLGSFMSMWKMMEQYIFISYYLTAQAIFHAAAGETDQAIAALEDASEIALRTGQCFYQAETTRYRARLRPTAEEQASGFREAMELAGRQGAAAYELNAAVDLANVENDATDLNRVLQLFADDATFPALADARELASQLSESR